ncbi:MAG: hypothetical protein SFV23_24465 [Planctomycetaceae bacterium]|nr:hypothetical protein [Planctomycetaceae bacterium]
MTPDVNVRSLQFVRVFPWLRIGRAIGCALAPSQMVLGLLAALLWWTVLRSFVFVSPSGEVSLVDSHVSILWAPLLSQLKFTASPLSAVISPWQRILATPDVWSFRPLLESAAAFVLWTVLGVAIARCAAVQFCRDQGPSFRRASQWSLQRCVTSLTSILTPLGGVLMIALGMAVLALPGCVPGLGQLWLFAVAPVEALSGLVVASILLLLPVLWPLMVAAVAVDDADSFSAFSRSFSYVTTHLWTTAALILCNLVAAALAAAAAEGLSLGCELSLRWIISHTLGAEDRDLLMRSAAWWLAQFRHGFAASLFWTHVTIVYLFLRESVDGTPLDTLAGYEDDTRFHEPYPVVGMPAVQGTEPT